MARELGVKYVLEGSVRRAGDQVRINAQLIDAATGGHLWAERYDGTLDDVFALQDRITRKIVEALALHLTADEEQRLAARGTDNPAAYDSFLKGWDHYVERTPEGFAKAIPHFEQALALDPIYGRAHAALASIYWEGGAQRFWYEKLGLFWGETRTRAKEHLEQALKYPTPLAHRVASLVFLSPSTGGNRLVDAKQDFDQGLSEAQKAIALEPNDPEGHIAMAHALTMSGRPSEALAFVEAAMRLNPNYPSDYQFEAAFAHFGMDEFEKAANLLEQALERNPQDPVTGHKSLYGVGQSPFAIDGVPDEVARQLLWDLREHCIQPRFRYHHKYQVGDLVIFDSYSTLHAATRIGIAESAKDENARLNWRISVRGLPGVHRHLAA